MSDKEKIKEFARKLNIELNPSDLEFPTLEELDKLKGKINKLPPETRKLIEQIKKELDNKKDGGKVYSNKTRRAKYK